MSLFRLRHATTYAFSAPAILGPHTLYLRPRADHRLKLNASGLNLSPPADVVWRNDLYGNSVAIARFDGQTDGLEIISELDVETFPRSESQRRRLLEIGEMFYSPHELHVLFAFTDIDMETRGAVMGWISHPVGALQKSPYERLLECAARIRYEFDYRPRYEPGVQKPQETLNLHSGACRDFAELMIACARSLGFAGRFVTGYVFTPDASPGSSSPHAWAETYMPAVGWIELDVTNGLVDDGDLIPIASASRGTDLTPISGTYKGSGVTSSMHVEVDVWKTG